MDEGLCSRKNELADRCMHATIRCACGLGLQWSCNNPFSNWEDWCDREAELAQDIHLHIRKSKTWSIGESKKMRVLVLLCLSVLQAISLFENRRTVMCGHVSRLSQYALSIIHIYMLAILSISTVSLAPHKCSQLRSCHSTFEPLLHGYLKIPRFPYPRFA